MKTKLLLTLGACLLFHYSFSQKNPISSQVKLEIVSVKDSALIKMVKGINEVLKTRVRSSFPRHSIVAYADYVIIEKKGAVDIDSLYKYNLKDFKNITISFEEHPALYGGKSEYGVIILKKK